MGPPTTFPAPWLFGIKSIWNLPWLQKVSEIGWFSMRSSLFLKELVIWKESNRSKSGNTNCQTGLEEEIQRITLYVQVDSLTRNCSGCSEVVNYWGNLGSMQVEKEDEQIEAPELVVNSFSYKSKWQCNWFDWREDFGKVENGNDVEENVVISTPTAKKARFTKTCNDL